MLRCLSTAVTSEGSSKTKKVTKKRKKSMLRKKAAKDANTNSDNLDGDAPTPLPISVKLSARNADSDVLGAAVLLASTRTDPSPAPHAVVRSADGVVNSSPLASADEQPHDELQHPTVVRHLTQQSLLLERQVIVEESLDAAVGAAEGGLVSAVRYESQDRIERRRSRPTVSDVEFEVGMSERLLPQLKRLVALSEVHYTDCIVSCWDEESLVQRLRASLEHSAVVSHEAESSSMPKSVSMGVADAFDASGATERSFLDDDDDDEGASICDHNIKTKTVSAVGSSSSISSPQADRGENRNGEEGEPSTKPGGGALVRDAMASQALPWTRSMAPNGHFSLPPLTADEIQCLHRFLMELRGQQPLSAEPSCADAGSPNCLRVATTWQELETYLKAPEGGMVSPVLPFSTPPPVEGSSSGSETTDLRPPAWIFYLYTENTSTQNAIAHMAALFGVPVRNFITSHVASKMTCTTVLAAVTSNTVTRKQLLLLNTMRHPGFVLKVAGIAPAPDGLCDTQLFSDFAIKMKTITDVSMLLRRVSGTRAEIAQRLEALRDVGAIFYCGSRELSLARAATDVIHGYYRSAFLNALYRRHATVELRRFLKRPSIQTAADARRTAGDASVRQMLKRYIANHGNFKAAVMQTPYATRRRWLNTLRCTIWNTMAATRIREVALRHRSATVDHLAPAARLHVIIGDLLLKPEFREDAHLRKMPNVKAEHLFMCTTQEEADAATLEDVFIPFLKGRLPAAFVAPESTNHPIMTQSALQSITGRLHARALLTGLSDEAKRILDIREEASPMLFRRLIMTPLALEYEILEDRPNVRSLHFDASRLWSVPRVQQQYFNAGSERAGSVPQRVTRTEATSASSSNAPDAVPESMPMMVDDGNAPMLYDRGYVLSHTTFSASGGGRHFGDGSVSSSAVDSEPAFFHIPTRNDYVVLGRSVRRDSDGFATRAPVSHDVESFDRVMTIRLRVLCPNGASGLAALLREYFSLSGIKTEEDSKLQHKVHRTQRELDPETPLLCQPTFCTACYNRCHDSVEVCAEYQFKKGLHAEKEVLRAALLSVPSPDDRMKELSTSGDARSLLARLSPPPPSALPAVMVPSMAIKLCVRRRTSEGRWGLRLHAAEMRVEGLPEDDAMWSVRELRQGHDGDGFVDTEALQELASEIKGSASRRVSTCGAERVQGALELLHDITHVAAAIPLSPSSSPSLRKVLRRLIERSYCDASSNSVPGAEGQDNLRFVWRVTHVNNAAVANRRALGGVLAQLSRDTEMELTLQSETLNLLQGSELTNPVPPSLVEPSVTQGRCLVEPTDSELTVATEFGAILPEEVTLILTTASPVATAGKQRSWGVRVSASTLHVLNLGTLLSRELFPSGADPSMFVVTVPPMGPLLSSTSAGSSIAADHIARLDHVRLYKVVEANGLSIADLDMLRGVLDSAEDSVALVLRRELPPAVIGSLKSHPSSATANSSTSGTVVAPRPQLDLHDRSTQHDHGRQQPHHHPMPLAEAMKPPVPFWWRTAVCDNNAHGVSFVHATEPVSPFFTPSYREEAAGDGEGAAAAAEVNLKRLLLTFAVVLHRSAAAVGTMLWGLRVEHQTCRLKSIPSTTTNDDQWYSEVLLHPAALDSTQRSDIAATRRSLCDLLHRHTVVSRHNNNGSMVTFVPYACIVVGVSNKAVSTHAELGSTLRSHAEESVMLHVVRVALPTLRLRCCRQRCETPSATDAIPSMPSWGLRVAADLTVECVERDSPCGLALRHFLQQLPENDDDGVRHVVESCLSKVADADAGTTAAAVDTNKSLYHNRVSPSTHAPYNQHVDEEVDDDEMTSADGAGVVAPRGHLHALQAQALISSAVRSAKLRVQALRIGTEKIAEGTSQSDDSSVYDTDMIEGVADHFSLAAKMRSALHIELILQVVVSMD